MGKNLLVINVDIRETRVALIENGIIAELHIERESSKGTLGNIYVGKVSRVLPGMQAAFIDVGLERAAFLHVEDLIRPDDFEAYLAGHRRGTAATDEDRQSGPAPEEAVAAEDAQGPAPAAAELQIELPTAIDAMTEPTGAVFGEDEEEEEGAAHEARADDFAPLEDVPMDTTSDAEAAALSAEADDDEELVSAGLEAAEGAGEREDEEADGGGAAEAAGEDTGGIDMDALEGAAVDAGWDVEPLATEGGAVGVAEAVETASVVAGTRREPARDRGGAKAEQPADAGGGRTKRGIRTGRDARVRRSGRTRDRRGAQQGPEKAAPVAQPQAQQRERGGGGRGGQQGGRGARPQQHEPPRVSKTTPIREVVREGQEVLVQISKEPIGTKGARVTSHISLPGRYVVYLPTVDHVGISKRIGSEKERSRLRESIDAMKPPTGGLIVRTLAEGLTKKQLKADVGYLVRLWGEVVKKRETASRAPDCLYTELDLVLKTARDLFSDDIEKIVIDDREQYGRLKRFVEVFMPERADAVELYEGEEPIFDAYGIEDEIGRALSRKVPLHSGGHLIIDQAEALTAIDVNTGRFVGKGSRDLEETILTTNLEAVEEIAYQLRFRNIGGLIILDLIDMERAGNREKVRKRLEQLLAKDKAKTTLNRISELGLIEMTRKRTRESLGRTIHEPCFYCDGTGQLQSKQTVAYEILRQIRRERMNLRGYSIVVNAHPAVVDFLKNDERTAVIEAERLFTRRIELVPRKEYHLEQFDLLGK